MSILKKITTSNFKNNPQGKNPQINRYIPVYMPLHDNELKHLSQRYSNNDEPEFTDQEIMTIYIYAMQQGIHVYSG